MNRFFQVFYDNPSDITPLVSSNDERLTRILYETLNSVETHFLATRNFTWEGDDGRTNNGNGRSGCESSRDVGWGVGKVHRAERERFVVVPLKRRYRSENIVTWSEPGFSIGVHNQQPENAIKNDLNQYGKLVIWL